MRIKASTLAVVTGLAWAAAMAQAEPFVFQGQLNDGGAPAEGLYDLEFELYPAEAGGTQIGPTVSIDDLQVSNGTFQAELDFGDDAFDGSTRWIGISVRPGDSVDAYTALDPRAKLGSAPQASFATRASVADTLTEPFWTQAPGVLYFGRDEGHDKFFFNRNRVIVPTDIMVVYSGMNGPGGLTVASWPNGMPYYGYATSGQMRVKSYYDPVTDAWVVNKGGTDMLEIDNNNDVVVTNNLIVGGTITSMGDGEAQVGYKSYTPESIFENFGFDRAFNAFAGAIVTQGTTGYLRTNLELPHNAQITSIRIEFVDRTNASNLRVQLWKRELLTLNYTTETLSESSGANDNMVQVMMIEPAVPITIDNTLYTYALRVFSTSGAWPANGLMGIRNILVEYTYTMP